MKKSFWVLLGIASVLLVLVVTIGLWATSLPLPRTSPPDVVRPWTASGWAELTSPTPRTAVLSGLGSLDLPSVSVSAPDPAGAHEVKLEGLVDRMGTNSLDVPDFSVVRVTPGMEAGISIEAIGIGYRKEAGESPHSSVDGTYYAPDGSPLSDVRLKKLLARHSSNFHPSSGFPAVEFVLSMPTLKNPKMFSHRLYDAHSHVNLSGGGSTQQIGEYWKFGTDSGCWHEANLMLAIDVAHGPLIRHTIPFEIGESIASDDGFEARIVHIADGYKMGESGSDDKMSLSIRGGTATTHTSALLYVIPSSGLSAASVEFVLADGKTRNFSGSWGSGRMSGSVKVPRAEIVSLDFNVRTQFTRYLIEIGPLPGLPKENLGVTDLFDVTVPYVQFDGSWQSEQFLAEVVQFQRHGSHPNTGSYPVEFKNRTVRELLKEYESLHGDGSRDVRNSDFSLRFGGPEPAGWDRMKLRLGW